MNAVHVYKLYCENFAPPGPCGTTLDDVVEVIERFSGLSEEDKKYNVVRTLQNRKNRLLDRINREHNGNR